MQILGYNQGIEFIILIELIIVVLLLYKNMERLKLDCQY
jgi:hypothetical protein